MVGGTDGVQGRESVGRGKKGGVWLDRFGLVFGLVSKKQVSNVWLCFQLVCTDNEWVL